MHFLFSACPRRLRRRFLRASAALCAVVVYGGHGASALAVEPPGVRELVQASAEDRLRLATPYARLAADAYSTDRASALPAGFVPLDEPRPEAPSMGFQARLYGTAAGDQIVIAFAGTDLRRPGSLWTDAELVAGKLPAQFVQAEAYVRAVRKHYPGRDLLLVGHSLGGSLAIFTAQKLGLSAFAFNAAVLNNRLWDQVPPSHKSSFKDGPWYINFQSSGDSLTALRIGRDPVSNLAFGSQAVVEIVQVKTGCEVDVLCHSIDHFQTTNPHPER